MELAGARRQPRLVQRELAAREDDRRGLPDFGPVQNNVSFNDWIGTTRGIHAEPWDKWVSIAAGASSRLVHLREGPTFGAVFTAELDPSRAIFVPRGVGNAYQTLRSSTPRTPTS